MVVTNFLTQLAYPVDIWQAGFHYDHFQLTTKHDPLIDDHTFLPIIPEKLQLAKQTQQ